VRGAGGDAVVESALEVIADFVQPAPRGTVRAVVVNPDATTRHQIVEAFIDLPVDSAEPWRLVDAQVLRSAGRLLAKEAAITEVAGPDGQRSSSGAREKPSSCTS